MLESRDVELKEWEGKPCDALLSSSDSSSLLRDLSLSISLRGLYQFCKHDQAMTLTSLPQAAFWLRPSIDYCYTDFP